MVFTLCYFQSDCTSCITHLLADFLGRLLYNSLCRFWPEICHLMPRSCYYWCFEGFCFYCLHIGCFRKFCHLFHGRCTGRTSRIGNRFHAYNILFYLAMGFEYVERIFEFVARLLLIQLCLSLLFRKLLAALGSVLRALCCFVERSSLLLLDFFHYIACRNSFCDLFGRIYLRSCIFHKASRSQIIVLEFLSFQL